MPRGCGRHSCCCRCLVVWQGCCCPDRVECCGWCATSLHCGAANSSWRWPLCVSLSSTLLLRCRLPLYMLFLPLLSLSLLLLFFLLMHRRGFGVTRVRYAVLGSESGDCTLSHLTHLNESTRGLGQPRRVIQLDALLFWEAIDSLPDPMVQLPPPHATADQSATSLIIATANVLTFHPQEEAQGGHPLPAVRPLRSKYGRLALTSWGFRRADRERIISSFVRATKSGSLLQHRGALAGRSFGSARASATTHAQTFQSVTRLDLWLPATYKVILLIFVFCMLRRHISLPELKNGGKAREPYSAGFSSRLGTGSS